jgi:hypothetical protein
MNAFSNNMNAYCVVKKVPKPAEVYIFANADEVTSFLWGKQPADWLVCKAVNEMSLDLDQLQRRLVPKTTGTEYFLRYDDARDRNFIYRTVGDEIEVFAMTERWVEFGSGVADFKARDGIRTIPQRTAEALFPNAFK